MHELFECMTGAVSLFNPIPLWVWLPKAKQSRHWKVEKRLLANGGGTEGGIAYIERAFTLPLNQPLFVAYLPLQGTL